MPIDRTNYNALVDDDGSNLVGTLWSKNIVKTVILDPADAAIAVAVQTTTLTGTQHNFVLVTGARDVTLRCANAADLTITGFLAGVTGQRIRVEALGPGNVYLAPEHAGSAATNRLTNRCTTAPTPLAAGGTAEYEYDATRWRLAVHEQGAPIPYAVTWTAQTTNPALGNGTLTGAYTLRGRAFDVQIQLTIGSTTTLGTGFWAFSLPIPMFGGAIPPAGTGFVTNGGGNTNNTMLTVISAFLHAGGDIIGVLCSSSLNIGSATPSGMTTGDSFRGAAFAVPVG